MLLNVFGCFVVTFVPIPGVDSLIDYLWLPSSRNAFILIEALEEWDELNKDR